MSWRDVWKSGAMVAGWNRCGRGCADSRIKKREENDRGLGEWVLCMFVSGAVVCEVPSPSLPLLTLMHRTMPDAGARACAVEEGG